MYYKKIIAFTCCLWATLYAAGQSYSYRFVNYTYKDGLADKFIYDAAQDKKGYLWFGTLSGLYQFDGHQFKKIRSPLDKPGASVGNVLQAVMADEAGHLWLGAYTSLQWYDPSTGKFWQPAGKNIKLLSGTAINKITPGKYTWICTASKLLCRFSKADSTFTSFAQAYPAGASTSVLNAIEIKNEVYAIHAEGMYVFDTAGHFLRAVAHRPADISAACYNSQNQEILLSSYGSGILRLRAGETVIGKVAPHIKLLTQNHLLSIAVAANGDIFCGGYPLFIYHPQRDTITSFGTTDNKNEFSIQNNKIVAVFKDRESNMWLCSHNGLSMLPWQNSQVQNLPVQTGSGVSAEPFAVQREPGNPGKLLVANNGAKGLLRIDINTGSAQLIRNPYANLPGGDFTRTIIIASDSTVYTGDDNYFFRYDQRLQQLKRFIVKDQDGKEMIRPGRNITLPGGDIYIASENNGFYIWEYAAGKLTHVNKKDVLPAALASDNNMIPTLADSRQDIWFMCTNGIVRRQAATGRYTHYSTAGNETVPLLTEVMYMAQDKKDHYWLATRNNGLYELFFTGDRPQWKNYTVNSGIGLPSDYNLKIRPDPADSTIWISNSTGLLKFDPFSKKVISVLSMQNGLAAEGSGYGFTILPPGLLVQQLFGNLSLIDLQTYRWNNSRPHVQFNSVKVMSREYVYSLGDAAELDLSHDNNYLQIEFAALIFNNSNRNQYAYKLDNADAGWIYSGQLNTATYTGLAYGNYTFRVKAAGSDGVWGDETLLRVHIRPPVYLQWWFITLALCLLLLLAWYAYRYRLSQVRREEQIKASFRQQLVETEMKALRAQMNPHFIFNSLNSIQKYVLRNQHYEASQYLTRFSRLMRLILDHSNQQNISLASETGMLELYLEMEALRFDHAFDYSITVSDAIPAETICIPSMLIQPYVENAIWHGLLHKKSKGTLQLSFSPAGDQKLQVVIDDNGVGREKAGQLRSKQVLRKKSYGMQITENRISLLNQLTAVPTSLTIIDKKDEAGNAAGTTVTLIIPFNFISQ